MRPTLQRLQPPLSIYDLACGNSYLTFVLAEALRLADLDATIHGVDRREDVVERSRARADALGWTHLTFDVQPIRNVALPGDVDLVMALHACDTATDEALALAIQARAKAIFAAPCCQRELANQLQPDHVPAPALAKVGLLKRDYAATLTDALRVEILQASGYTVDALEFVASDHTPKNLLLRAHRRGDPRGLDHVQERCTLLGVQPTLLTLLDVKKSGCPVANRFHVLRR